MASCQCGCGQESKSEFLPGHDQKLRAQLESRLGGILHLRALVDAAESYALGSSSESEFTRYVRSLFESASDTKRSR
jgi:hypothetical protein